MAIRIEKKTCAFANCVCLVFVCVCVCKHTFRVAHRLCHVVLWTRRAVAHGGCATDTMWLRTKQIFLAPVSVFRRDVFDDFRVMRCDTTNETYIYRGGNHNVARYLGFLYTLGQRTQNDIYTQSHWVNDHFLLAATV